MIQAYRVEDIRTAEEAALASVPVGALMQRAAAGLATACIGLLRERHGRVTGCRVVVLAGAGNNGGDALWAGSRLADRGADVCAVPTARTVHPEGLAALQAAGGRVLTPSGDLPAQAATALVRADLVIDGLVGLGGSPGLREPANSIVQGIPDDVPVVAVDLPSGVDPDSGLTPGAHVRAHLTVTFGAAKPCLLLPPADRAAGRVEIVDIGLTPYLPFVPQVERLTELDAAAMWPLPGRDDDKYRRGVLGVVAGSPGYPGAAVLACSGALRAGVGMVRYVGPPEVTTAVLSAWPEVVSGPGRVQAWLLGPGVDPDAEPDRDPQPDAVTRALDAGLPCVLDAGAITLWARALSPVHDDRDQPDDSRRILLTPHAGELARLLTDLGAPTERADVEARPYPHAHAAARRTGATVLLKGATTLVVRPDGRARSQHDGVPWLATAGAGDVLAGIAGTLLAAGLDPLDAGSLAALLHGRAAAAASRGGPIVSADVAAALPGVVAELLGPD